ncbi:MAG TPA: hypothetical protein VE978_13260 [Chitinophagales bacterium]|nr:hypothetical protein [Chitinophagales bacterium]
MEVKILASKVIEHRTWYLCSGNLLVYLDSLKDNFYEFAIQRRIVKNQYLDFLYYSIKDGDPIPLITLTTKQQKLEVNKSGISEVDMQAVEILDGLQRTFRLWAYKILSEKYNGETDKAITEFAKRLKEENDLFFETGVLSTSLIRSFITSNEIIEVKKVFSGFEIYLVVWSGLKEKEIIEKMLVLNAGQKAVSKTHQFELLFLHFYDEIRASQPKVNLLREKEKKASEVKKGNRDLGEFMFSSVIVALQSFVEKKPLRVSTEDLIGLEPEEETKAKVYESVFSSEFIKDYLSQLYTLDEAVYENDKDRGKEWFVKDTSLSGVFAAVGKYINIDDEWDKSALRKAANEGFKVLRNNILHRGFKLKEFTNEYNTLSSRSGNIGNIIRKVVMNYTFELLQGNNPEWKDIFDKSKERK